MTIGARLKTERERLGLSQAAFGKLGSVGKTTVIAWERGAAHPNAAFLEAAATAGVDVQFIVTGITRDAHRRLDLLEHASEIAAMEHDDFVEIRALSKRLHALLQHYLRCSPADQARVGQLAELLAVKQVSSPPGGKSDDAVDR